MQESDGHNKPPSDPQLRFPLPPGTRVDHYVIKEVLGAGGFGITYLAEHEALGKLYAIKEYFPHAFSFRQGKSVRPTSASDGTYNWGLERFVTEARRWPSSSTPPSSTSPAFSRRTAPPISCLAYESGVDMAAWLKRLGRPPTQDELDRILRPLLGALEEVHRHSMMHRDISPDNLLIREDNRPVLIDFGSAREQIRGRARALSAIVKHGYSPPEQYTSKPELQGPWTDIYALSATLYRAIGGQLPPDATERFLRDELAPIARVAREAYRPGFLDAIDRGLRMKVEERPQTIVEWRERLFRSEPLVQPSNVPPNSLPSGHGAQQAGGAARSVSPSPAQSSHAASARADSRFPAVARQGASPIGASHHPRSVLATGGAIRSRGSSIPKSERPDLSWLDDTEDLPAEMNQTDDTGNMAQTVYYGILGSLGGATAGGLISVVIISAVATQCFADGCILRYLALASGIGAVIGAIAGIRYAHAHAAESSGSPLPPSSQL